MADIKIPRLGCGEGWHKLINPLIDLCKLYEIDIMQIKEKFGGLRFYIHGVRQDLMWPIISAVEAASYRTCEDCGTDKITGFDYTTGKPKYLVETKVIKEGGFWIKSLCPDCRTARANELG